MSAEDTGLAQRVDRYVRRQMTPDEERAFEEFYLDDEEAFRQVEAAQALAQAARQGAFRAASAPRTTGAPGWLRGLLAGASATALLVLGFGLGRVGLDPGRPQAEALQLVMLEATRSSGSVRTVDTGDAPVALEILVPLNQSGPFHVSLRTPDTTLLDLRDLVASYDGRILVRLEPELLRSDTVTVEVHGAQEGRLFLRERLRFEPARGGPADPD